MSQEKYIGYLESQIANTMWPSGLCREERKPFQQVYPRLETARFDSPLLLDIVLRCYRLFRKARRLSGGLKRPELVPFGDLIFARISSLRARLASR
jgi:hypothetical protein